MKRKYAFLRKRINQNQWEFIRFIKEIEAIEINKKLMANGTYYYSERYRWITTPPQLYSRDICCDNMTMYICMPDGDDDYKPYVKETKKVSTIKYGSLIGCKNAAKTK